MDGDGRITQTPTQAIGHGRAFDGGKGAKAVQAAPLAENATQHFKAGRSERSSLMRFQKQVNKHCPPVSLIRKDRLGRAGSLDNAARCRWPNAEP